MKSTVLPFLFLFAVAVIAHPIGGIKNPTLNQNFDLKAGQSVQIQGTHLSINFQSVTEDSRCPENVKCVWAGNAKVDLIVRRGGYGPPSTSISLNTGLDPKHVSYNGYEIKLVGVKPPRKENEQIGKGDYVITLLVTKKQS